LVFHVAFYDSPTTTSANRTGIVAISPEFSTPKLLLEIRQLQEQLASCDALQDAHDLTNAVLGMKAN